MCGTLMLEANAIVIERCKEELLQTPIADWVKKIEETASTVHIANKGSV
jgi:hypothetical protein